MLRLSYKIGIWIDITTLVIQKHNDDPQQLRDIATFIADIDKNIPWHLSAFYPTYKLTDVDATPRSSLKAAHRIGREAGLRNIYLGNVGGISDTLCPHCGATLIERRDMRSSRNRIEDNRCPECGAEVAGVWR